MTKADELNALADRCEREEPSEALDGAIAVQMGWRLNRNMPNCWMAPGHSRLYSAPPRYTTSLDAAVTPTGENVFWRSGHDGEGPDPSLFKAEVLVVTEAGSRSCFGRARTEAMARRAAELRARASLLPAKEGE